MRVSQAQSKMEVAQAQGEMGVSQAQGDMGYHGLRSSSMKPVCLLSETGSELISPLPLPVPVPHTFDRR